MTFGWFGVNWGATVCDPDENVETPVGQKCCHCDEPVAAGDRGIIMPGVEGDERGGVRVYRAIWHLRCVARDLGVELPPSLR